MVPIDDVYCFDDLLVAHAAHMYIDAVLEALVDLAVGMSRAEGAAVTHEVFDRQVDSLLSQPWIEPLQRGSQAGNEHDFTGCGTSQGAMFAKCFMKGVDGLIAELREQGDGRLLYQGVFGVVVHPCSS